MERRMVLAGATAAAARLLSNTASAADPPSADLAAALARFRASIPSNFDPTYVENAVIPFFLTSLYEGERPALPMIDVTLTKENALPHDLWGLIYQGWKPTPEEGVTVFLQGLEKRGDNNLRKRIYMFAVTPDLYRPMYGAKVVAFFDALLDPKFAGRRSSDKARLGSLPQSGLSAAIEETAAAQASLNRRSAAPTAPDGASMSAPSPASRRK